MTSDAASRARSPLTDDSESERESAGFLILGEAGARLESVDPAAAVSVVRRRYDAGLDVDPTAAALDSSPATVKRTCDFAGVGLEDVIESDRA